MNLLPPSSPPDKIDRMKHFAKDEPTVKLKALLIERAPAILWSVIVGIGAAIGAYKYLIH